MAKSPVELANQMNTVGSDLSNYYDKEFFKAANGNKEQFVNHMINRFGIPRGSNRAKEIDFYGKKFDKMNLENQNLPLRDRWNRYINEGIGSGENIDYWNNEIMDIEKQLPFKDQPEHDKWLNMGATWMGEPEWLNMTDELLKRYEGGK